MNIQNIQNKINNALKEFSRLKSIILKKSKENKKYIESLKDKFKNIDGILFAPNEFENKSLKELGKILETSFPGILENSNNIFSENINSQIFNDFSNEDLEFSKEEIQKVLDEWNKQCNINNNSNKEFKNKEIDNVIKEKEKECDKLNFIPPFIPFTQKEIKEIVCQTKTENNNIVENEIKIENEDLNELFLDKKPEKELNIENLNEFIKAYPKPEIQIVFCLINATVIDILANVGDNVNCNSPIIKTDKGIIPAGIKNGIITKINVRKGENIKGKNLFEIKINENKTIFESVINETKKQIENANKLIKLKEKLIEKEKQWYYSEIETWFYKYRYEAYAEFYNNFTSLVKERQEKNLELKNYYQKIKNIEKQINNIFGINNFLEIETNDKNTINKIQELIDLRNFFIKKVNILIKEINDLTSKINQIRKENTIFAKYENEILPKIVEGGNIINNAIVYVNNSKNYLKNPIGNQTVIQLFVPEKNTIEVPSPDVLARDLQKQIKYFTNEIGFEKLTLDKINTNTIKTYNPKLKKLELKEAETGERETRWINSVVIGNNNTFRILSTSRIGNQKDGSALKTISIHIHIINCDI